MGLILLNEVSIDIELLIKQYKWLCNLTSAEGIEALVCDEQESLDAREGLLNMIDEIWVDIFKTVHIYTNDGETQDRYLVIFPDSSVYGMNHDPCAPNGVCYYVDTEDAITWTEIDEVGMVPVGFMKEVSVLDVEPGVREKIRDILVDEGMDED